MHVRIDEKQVQGILDALDNAITRNLEFVNDYNYAEASGYARGGLIGIQTMIKQIVQYNSFRDDTDELIAEENALPEIPPFPSLYDW